MTDGHDHVTADDHTHVDTHHDAPETHESSDSSDSGDPNGSYGAHAAHAEPADDGGADATGHHTA